MHNGFFISVVGSIKDRRSVCMNKKLLAKLQDKKDA